MIRRGNRDTDSPDNYLDQVRLASLRSRFAARPTEGTRASPLPEGTLAVGAGLILLGVTSYGFLVVTGRVLGPDRYASLSALWALVYLAGPGFFLPVEQEVARVIAIRRARHQGHGPLLRRAGLAGGIAAVALMLAALLTSGLLVRRVFDGQALLLVGFELSLLGYCIEYLFRGALAGHAQFAAYGAVIGGEGVLRFLLMVGMALVGVRSAGPYGVALGLGPFLAVAAAGAMRPIPLRQPGPPAPWSELSAALGYLLSASVLGQALLNAAPLAVKLLASRSENALAGRFLAGVVVARVPLFLFQAIQAALLPRLAALAAAHEHRLFRGGVFRLGLLISAVGVLGTLGALAVGPFALRLLFGPDFRLARSDLVLLAAGSGVFMVAALLQQALIALSLHRKLLVPWMAGLATFGVTLALTDGLLLRAEVGFLAGATVVTVVMIVALARAWSLPGAAGSPGTLAELGHVALEV